MATRSASTPGTSPSRAPREREVFVGIQMPGPTPDVAPKIVTAGVLMVEPHVTPNADKSVGRFRYAPSYLARPDAVPLDPIHLPLVETEFRFVKFGGLPSCIRDSAPDNWGRLLIRRHYAARGINEPLSEVDYLLSSPMDRAGCLHFASTLGPQGPMWNRSALSPDALKDVSSMKSAVIEALNPASAAGVGLPPALDSLLTGAGGARPKVNVKTSTGMFLIKLANPVADEAANSRLEEASLRMAREVGIETADVTARSAKGFDFLTVRRFDVDGVARHQMLSAMSVLDADDQPYVRANWSYPALAREISRWSADPEADKLALFRSMVLRAMLSDADDHPRNYAFIRNMSPKVAAGPGEESTNRSQRPSGNTLGQWRLSPLFDCVVGMGRGYRASELAMEIGDYGCEISQRNILSQCAMFGLDHDTAKAEMLNIEAKVMERFESILDDCGAGEEGRALARRSVATLDSRPNESAIEQLLARSAPATEQAPGPTASQRPRAAA